MNKKVEESSEYDNFIGKFNERDKPASLDDYFGETKAPEISIHDWRRHWKGMPEFENNANKCYKKLIVNFKTEEDYLEFAKLLDISVTEKTKYIYYPMVEKQNNLVKRWIDDVTE